MAEGSPRPSDRAGADGLTVAHVIHSLGAGGAEALLVDLAAAAPQHGIRVVVVGLSDAQDARTVPLLRAAGATVYELHGGRYDIGAIARVAAVLRREGVDIVHTHLKHADVVGGLAARLTGRPVVSTLHVIESEPAGSRARAQVRLAAAVRSRLFGRVIVLSEAQRRWYERVAPGSPIVLLPNGIRPLVPDRTRAEVRRELDVADGEVLSLTLSLMRPEKGHATLLDAVRRIPAEVPLVAALAGDGELLDHVRATVADDPVLRRRVRVLGFRRDVADLLSAADLVVHPSFEDALPTALICGLSMGIPIVATQVGGIPDIVGDAGELVPAGDADALAAAIGRYAVDAAAREMVGMRGYARFVEKFDVNVWINALKSLYASLRWTAD